MGFFSYVADYFLKSPSDRQSELFKTEKEWKEFGLQNLEMTLFGSRGIVFARTGVEVVKDLDELSKMVVEYNLFSSPEEFKQALIDKGGSLNYHYGSSDLDKLKIDLVSDISGKVEKCRVRRDFFVPDC